jgi:tartrate dehydrogenase/decarboxylase/D-malate dehydrogenase
VANPIAQIWSGALMLEFLGHKGAHDAILSAIETVLSDGPRTPDMGGKAVTADVGKAVAEIVAKS